jgi:hypothetical protein
MIGFYDLVRKAVHTQWDPAGLGELALDFGEYDSYIPGLCELLQKPSSGPEVLKYLWTIETETLGLRGNREATEQFAKWLCELKVT